MAYWQYVQQERLTPTAIRGLRLRMPNCPECGDRNMMRLALREPFAPWQWKPSGWQCPRCGATYIEVTG